MLCPHGGQVTGVPGSSRVLVGGAPALTLTDTYTVVGCAFNVSGAPQPCTTVRWLAGATRVLADGRPLLVQSGTGLGQSAAQVPQGPATVVSCQPKVVAQ